MEAKELKKVLARAKKGINVKTSIPEHACANLHNGTMTVYKNDNLGSHWYTFKDDVFENIHDCLVNFDMLSKLIGKIKRTEPLELEVFEEEGKGDVLQVKVGKLKFTLPCTEDALETFPICEATIVGEPIVIGQATANLIQKAYNYVAKDELRPNLCNVSLDKEGFVVGSDANVMAAYKSQKFLQDIMVNSVFLDKSCSLSIDADNKYLFISMENEEIIQSITSGNYPNWKSVFQSSNHNISCEVEVKEFAELLDYALVSANPASHLGSLLLTQDKGILKAEDIDLGTKLEVEIPASEGGDINIGFKISLMQKILKTEKFEGDVKLRFKQCKYPCPLFVGDEVLLMPMMLS